MIQERRPGALIFQKRLLGWSETFIAEQGKALDRYRPVFIGYSRRGAGLRYLDDCDKVLLEDSSASRELSKGLLKALRFVTPRWRRALEARNPAVLHAHFGPNAFDAIGIARTLSVPLVVSYHGYDITRKDHREWFETRRRNAVFRAAAAVIAVSEFIAERLRRVGCPADKMRVHNIGIDTARFHPGRWVERSPTRILFVGRLVQKKGLIHLLRAMPEIQRAISDAELVIAGDGELREHLEREAARLGAACSFLGVQPPDRVRELMRGAALFCAPSVVGDDGNAEGLPMTVLEAQSSGLPIVAFPSGGLAEGMHDGKTGYVVEPRDEQALAARIVELLRDADRRRRFGEAARALVVERFDLARQTAKLEMIYDDVRASGR